MLIEVKVKVARVIDNKTRKRTETYILDREFFSQAEYAITELLNEEEQSGLIEDFHITSLRESGIKEIVDKFKGDFSFLATLKDIWLEDDGTEKYLKYKVLLWADSPSQAMSNTLQLSKEGYDMQIEGIKQVDYEYLAGDIEKEETEEEELENE
jgi:hypothetical protein